MVCSELPADADEQANKKIKTESQTLGAEVIKDEIVESLKIKSSAKSERCIKCKQFLDNVPLYNGHPNHSNEEFIALTDDKLSLFTGKEENIHENDEIPTHQLTYFSVYDEKGHLCSLDAGLIETNIRIFASGYLKPVYDENPSPDDGVPGFDLGPINEWWTAGYDGGEKLRIGFSTEYANYFLMDPSSEYEVIFNKIKEKIQLSKIVIEFLLDEAWENPNYEDLVQQVQSVGLYENVEDILLQNAQFLCDQVLSYDQASSDDEKPFISLPCMRTLVKIAGVTFQKRKKVRKTETQDIKIKKGPTWSKAVTTKLVADVFKNFFPDQLDKKDETKGHRKKRCGVCEACQSPDCGECNHCRDMLKFGGTGKSKQACKHRRCPNMAILDAELSDNEEEADEAKEEPKKNNFKQFSTRILHKVTWGDKSSEKYKGYECYSSAVVGDLTVGPGDCVMLRSENANEPLCVARVVRMFDRPPQRFLFHGQFFCRGADTILGETSDPRELFAADACVDLPLGGVVRKAEVEYRKMPENWSTLGGDLNLEETHEDDGKTFFYSKRYCDNRFVDVGCDVENWKGECDSCRRISEQKIFDTPVLCENRIQWKNEKYKVGTGVFLNPSSYTFKKIIKTVEPTSTKMNDDVLYPEFYRKKSDNIKGSNNDTSEPFTIGIIEDINKESKVLKVQVRIFFRPENTRGPTNSTNIHDLNLLYYSEEVVWVPFENVLGKCYLSFGENLSSTSEWTEKGPYRFYFTEMYDPKTHNYEEVPSRAKNIGSIGKGKGVKGKSKVKVDLPELPPDWGALDRPLRCMDVFAGCGGLSEGLHQAGIAEPKWAIEKDIAAANAYRSNNPDCKVFSDDCNDILKAVLGGEGGRRGLPGKGQVELLVGGPPCQGFSGMNRFNAGQYSLFKNSLVVSYLSFCEFYRPKYFILENVRNFVSFKRSMVLKLTLRCLLAMGYQVTFGVLQAGHYGVPQTRRRLIVMAAAPGLLLPQYPEPMHVFNKRGCQLSFTVDGRRYFNGCAWSDSAPYRTITVRDAMSDLPAIPNGCSRPETPYDGVDALSHFQKRARGSQLRVLVHDHVCKEMSELVEARIRNIPTAAGSDWRDLPNMAVPLADGTASNVLKYPYRTKRQKDDERPRGVCQCSVGGGCAAADKQLNTLIPWCLPHTADRHNHWAGLYGRLQWDGYFGTTITNPEPMGKQGRVLHPEQNRVVSVRECARSQGFPDKYKFFGNILDKHRQVGNAVPPPLGAALGREIRKAFVQTLNSEDK